MEHLNSLIDTSEKGYPFRINNEKKRKGLGRRVLKHLLLANYCLSVYVNNWREDLYTPLASKLTCFELFSVLLTIQLVVYPKLRNQEDVMYFCALAAIVFYLSFFYFRYYVIQLFKDHNVKREFQHMVNDLPFRTTAFIFLGSSSLITVVCAFKVICDYQDWVFLWNS